MTALPARTKLRTPVVVGDLARVTTSTARRTIAPGYLIAEVDLAGAFDTTRTRITAARIVGQGRNWITWESRLMGANEPSRDRSGM